MSLPPRPSPHAPIDPAFHPSPDLLEHPLSRIEFWTVRRRHHRRQSPSNSRPRCPRGPSHTSASTTVTCSSPLTAFAIPSDFIESYPTPQRSPTSSVHNTEQGTSTRTPSPSSLPHRRAPLRDPPYPRLLLSDVNLLMKYSRHSRRTFQSRKQAVHASQSVTHSILRVYSLPTDNTSPRCHPERSSHSVCSRVRSIVSRAARRSHCLGCVLRVPVHPKRSADHLLPSNSMSWPEDR